jgi:hypothetical protein
VFDCHLLAIGQGGSYLENHSDPDLLVDWSSKAVLSCNGDTFSVLVVIVIVAELITMSHQAAFQIRRYWVVSKEKLLSEDYKP